jgi:DNA-binding protein H-NS
VSPSMASPARLPTRLGTQKRHFIYPRGKMSLGGGLMKSDGLQSMSTDEMWSLYERVASILARKIAEEKVRLKERLRRLEYADGAVRANESATSSNRPRRAYPKVFPKYQNPRNPAERWSGRGKQPHWVRAQLKAGKKLEHLLIDRPSIQRRRQSG